MSKFPRWEDKKIPLPLFPDRGPRECKAGSSWDEQLPCGPSFGEFSGQKAIESQIILRENVSLKI